MADNTSVVVVISGGPHDKERFLTPARTLTEGDTINYLGADYRLKRTTAGRWEAVPSAPPQSPGAGSPERGQP